MITITIISNEITKCPEFHCTGVLEKIRERLTGDMRGFKHGVRGVLSRGHKKLEIAEMRPPGGDVVVIY